VVSGSEPGRAEASGKTNRQKIGKTLPSGRSIDGEGGFVKGGGASTPQVAKNRSGGRVWSTFDPNQETGDMAVKRGRPIGVGVVGLGRAGWGMHCRELEARPGAFAVVAACEPVMEARRDEFEQRFAEHDAKAYASFDAMLADTRVDLVSIASRTADHEPQAIAALRAGKHVCVDKPMAGDYASARRIVRAAEKSDGRLFVRHNRRFEAAFTAIRDELKTKAIGRVHTIRLRRQSFQHRADWQALKAAAGGQLLNWGPHLIDHALLLLDAPVVSIWSDLRKLTARGDAEDHVHLILTAENGRVCDLEISGGVALPEPEWAIHGDRGSLTCTGPALTIRHLDPDFKPPRSRATTGTPLGYAGGGLPWVQRTVEVTAEDHGGPDALWDAVHATIRRGRKFPITLEHALEVMRVIHVAKKGTPFA
jgi:predicted dehydrogenase